jgi:maleate cis-trans isomerase
MDEPLALGLMVPNNNTTMEPELLAWLPEGSCCRTVRIPRGKSTLTPADLPAYLALATTLARSFAEDEVDLVVYGCTAAGFMAGPARDADVAADLAKITRKRVVTTASAMTAVLEHVGARNIALITPYLDAVNERLRHFVESSGIKVEVLSSFHAQTVDELSAITAGQIEERAREVVCSGVDALFIACSQLPTRAILPGLERELKIPVWSSIRATAWQTMRAAEVASTR